MKVILLLVFVNLIGAFMESAKKIEDPGIAGNMVDKCVEVIRSEGLISSPYIDDWYPTRVNCLWMIRASYGAQVNIKFLSFFVKSSNRGDSCDGDYVALYDGRRLRDPLMAKLCGSNLRDPNYPNSDYRSSGRYLLVQFRIKTINEMAGWLAQVNFIATDQCSKVIDLNLDYPLKFPTSGLYENDATCTWLMRAPMGKYVQFQVENVDIEYDDSCSFDFVEFHDGNDANAVAIGQRLCGSIDILDDGQLQLKRTSTGRSMFVEFQSDESFQAKGFEGLFTVVDTPGVDLCPEDPITLNGKGKLTLPRVGSRYVNLMNCTYVIETLHPGIVLTFEHFDVELSPECDFDFLDIYDNPGSLEAAYSLCGEKDPGYEIRIPSNYVRLNFFSDHSVTATGFVINYESFEDENNESNKNTGSCGISYLLQIAGHIVGGNIAIPHSWPWQVSIRDKYSHSHFCGGSIISENVIVTAAHCVVGTGFSKDDLVILAGAHTKNWVNPEEPERQIREVSKIVCYPGFSGITTAPDVALIFLDVPLNFDIKSTHGAVFPVCLPQEGSTVPVEELCFVTGWGITDDPSNENYLNEVEVPIMSQQLCRQHDYYGIYGIKDYEVCAGYQQGGKDACQGDSGGPLVCDIGGKFELHGITSWGVDCGRAKSPGVYTRVTELIAWIKKVAGV